MKILNLKQMTIVAMLGTSLLLTGCGGGGGSSTNNQSNEIKFNPIPTLIAPDWSEQYDTDNDGFIGQSEAIIAWSSITPSQKSEVASGLGFTIAEIDSFISLNNKMATQGVADTKTNYVSERVATVRTDIDTDITNAGAAFDTELINEGITLEQLRVIAANNGINLPAGNNGKEMIESLISNESDTNAVIALAEDRGLLSSAQATELEIAGKYYRNIETATDLYNNLNVPGVEQAHKDGWTGKGIDIRVMDIEFDEGLTGHGFNVSLIASAVAPGANILEGSMEDFSIAANRNATITSKVITTSVGIAPADFSFSESNINWVENSDAIITVAAQHSNWSDTETYSGRTGRGGFSNCNYDYMTVSSCNTWAVNGLDSDNVIYVGEIDGDGNIPEWSNKAGYLHKDQFLVTASNALYNPAGDTNGNSFAAPRVAGAAALVRHKFPGLSGSETATTLLHTADDLGDVGVDSTYGHGRLNVGAALAPVGNLH